MSTCAPFASITRYISTTSDLNKTGLRLHLRLVFQQMVLRRKYLQKSVRNFFLSSTKIAKNLQTIFQNVSKTCKEVPTKFAKKNGLQKKENQK